MTIEEIKKANEEADAVREAEAKQEEAPVEPTPEEVAQKEAQEAYKVRQTALVQSVKALVETLVQDSRDFTVDELGWATDAFKNLLTIRTTSTEEHERLSKVMTKAQEEFYATKAKDLTLVKNETATETT